MVEMLFQFLNGAIRIADTLPLKSYSPDFNSSMVRLEYYDCENKDLFNQDFNSSMVRLE